ncbi:GNAT family N-acetyltransferase [Shimia thalassica]|uniref:N-acetyltransferase domain-containing protein n=1 Tax=Shimia thalassica TaxID=1715693 RepID=A0A0P1IC10_9RHOB|nr:GNAT family N-acetyltransferase [Shimia thalassica]MBU2943464.1 GNAT family N-acetyltransferase [Shimia thalassica]MDO6501534.1 GNAT family N-acetyltransferase [Shimia thalassica]MDO6797736.1 GNAT family N-acetyltransferase [Shimia thalassica]MDP2493442.1 GNAT family N-acetyltransferase [Shimia thalassica]MDP2517277.1 GNAT family N-acetyltransferase [Shimia thalassica]
MATKNIPIIETKRLVLRGPEPEDYPNFKATFASYRSRFMGGPLNAYETWMLYAAEIGHWNIRGYGMWMIHDKETDETYGMAGGWMPAAWPEKELAWIIWPDAAGQGYALEATHAARKYFYGELGWDSAVSYLDPKNLDSIRLAERLGAQKDKSAKTVDNHDVVYRHPSAEQLSDSQINHGIEMEISHYADPMFKPKGYALD